MNAKPKTIRIEYAEYISEYRLKIEFSDGAEQIVDFGSFLENSFHPEIKKFLNLKKFKKFKIENGDLVWGDFDLIFPIMDLYQNRLSPKKARAKLST